MYDLTITRLPSIKEAFMTIGVVCPMKTDYGPNYWSLVQLEVLHNYTLLDRN
jgi:hypothetical protein